MSRLTNKEFLALQWESDDIFAHFATLVEETASASFLDVAEEAARLIGKLLQIKVEPHEHLDLVISAAVAGGEMAATKRIASLLGIPESDLGLAIAYGEQTGKTYGPEDLPKLIHEALKKLWNDPLYIDAIKRSQGSQE